MPDPEHWPLASTSGCARGEKKTPYLFRLIGGGRFAFAGICDRSGDVPTFAIVTTEPNAVVAPIHDRMPVMLGRGEALWWADPGRGWRDALKQLCPFPEQQMERYPVTPEVGNARRDDPSLVLPAGTLGTEVPGGINLA